MIRLEQLLMTGKQDSISLEMEIRRPMRGDWIWSKQNYTVADSHNEAGSTDDDRSYGIRHYERKGRGKAF